MIKLVHEIRLRQKCLASRNKKEFPKIDKKHKNSFLMLIVTYLVLLKFLVNFGLFPKMLLLSHREQEVVKTSGSSDDNKKEFFETASHVLKNSGLFQGADV